MNNLDTSIKSIQYSELNKYLLLDIYDAYIKNQEIKDPNKEALFHYNLSENSVKKIIWDKATPRVEFAITHVLNYRNLLDVINQLFEKGYYDFFKANLTTKNIKEEYLEGYWYNSKTEKLLEETLTDYYKNNNILEKLFEFKTTIILNWINDINFKLAKFTHKK